MYEQLLTVLTENVVELKAQNKMLVEELERAHETIVELEQFKKELQKVLETS